PAPALADHRQPIRRIGRRPVLYLPLLTADHRSRFPQDPVGGEEMSGRPPARSRPSLSSRPAKTLSAPRLKTRSGQVVRTSLAQASALPNCAPHAAAGSTRPATASGPALEH